MMMLFLSLTFFIIIAMTLFLEEQQHSCC